MQFKEKVRFCRADLFARRAKLVTSSLMATLFLVIVAMVIAFGLAYGNQQVNDYRVHRDPLAGSVLVGDEIHTQQQLALGQLVEFESKLKSEFQSVVGVFGFRAVTMTVVDSAQLPFKFSGRTYRKGDPFVRELGATSCEIGSGLADGGLYVSQKLLDAIDMKDATLPLEIPVDVEGQIHKLPVDAIVDELPYHWWFVISEDLEKQMIQWQVASNLRIGEITTGVAPESWRPFMPDIAEEVGEQFASLKRVATDKGLQYHGAYWDEDTMRLSIALTESPLRMWEEVLLSWSRTLPEVDAASLQAFIALNPPEAQSTIGDLDHLAYDMAGIYVDDFGEILHAAMVADQEVLFRRFVDRESAKKLERANEQTKTSKQVARYFSLVLIAIASLGLLTTLSLRATQKTPEVGMMRVMGFSIGNLTTLWAIQAVILWAPSLLGFPVGWSIGKGIARIKYVGNLCEQRLGFELPLYFGACMAVSSLAACVCFILIPLWRWRRADASELLHR